jgi:DNA-binding CsgD family transcriptional regulator
VRNHVKGVLRSLDARSRVEAVAKGRRMGLI